MRINGYNVYRQAHECIDIASGLSSSASKILTANQQLNTVVSKFGAGGLTTSVTGNTV